MGDSTYSPILAAPSRAEIKDLLDEAKGAPGNWYCADCRATDPQWAIVNRGIFVCYRCKSVHREMGEDISKIKSMQLDLSWTREWLSALKTGNTQANTVLEANLPQAYRRPGPDDNTSLRRQFILAKYKRKEFCQRSEYESQTRRPLSIAEPPYLEGKMSGKLLKRARNRDEWLSRRLDLSFETNSLCYFKPQDQDEDQALRIVPLDSLNAMLVESETLSLVGPTILVLIYPESTRSRGGSLPRSPCSETKIRHIFFRGYDCQQGQDVVEWYMAIRQAKILAQKLSPTSEPTTDFKRLGWMNKKGKSINDTFKKRWFVLDGRMLRYYDNPTDATALNEVHIGSSKEGFAVKDGIPGSRRMSFFCFTLVTPTRSFWLRGMSFEDQTAWMAALDSVISGGAKGQKSDYEALLELQQAYPDD